MAGCSERAWSWFLGVYLSGLVGNMLMPPGLAGDVYFQAFGWSAVTVMAVRLWLRRRPGLAPLWLLTTGCALVLTGVLIMMLTPEPSVPGWPDVFYLASYVPQLTAMVLMVRRRALTRSRERLLDAAVISSGCALLATVLLIKPAITDAASAASAMVLAAYPIMDLFVLCLLVTMMLGGGLGVTAMRLIATGQLCILTFDTLSALVPAPVLDQYPLLMKAMITVSLAQYGLFATALLHPSLTRLAEPAPVHETRMTRMRTPLLWTAVMVGPALLLYKGWFEDAMVTDAPLIAIGCMVTFGLVVGRMQALVARVNAQSVRLTRQAEQLTEMATRDGLTGVLNRRSWDTRLAKGLEHAERHRLSTTVVIIDIDHFKRYNDTFGHQAGDRLLKGAAAAWGSQLRPGDVLARYGGEEFTMLLPCCDSRAAIDIVQRLRSVTPDGQSFSAGIATWSGGESADTLLARADNALYLAKRSGRNCSIVAEGHRGALTGDDAPARADSTAA